MKEEIEKAIAFYEKMIERYKNPNDDYTDVGKQRVSARADELEYVIAEGMLNV